ncbi:MAG: phenylalanine--tRNA ligase subunit alpha, partial [Methylococcales bacterium]|nr:phenylalanine--tRNA ligase subunit alpha [Methylococcales bacterium]
MSSVEILLEQAQAEVAQASDLKSLDDVRVKYLGKKGLLTDQLKQLGKLSAEDRPKVGQQINLAKKQIQTTLNEKKDQLKEAELNDILAKEAI